MYVNVYVYVCMYVCMYVDVGYEIKVPENVRAVNAEKLASYESEMDTVQKARHTYFTVSILPIFDEIKFHVCAHTFVQHTYI